MAVNLILSKESSESEIKAYFNAVLKLSQSDDEFPINLDEVWTLVYSRRQEAVRALTSNQQFIEGVDYQTVRKDAQQDSVNAWGGNNKIDYKLTVSCMEYFIARKVRPVFEVYRQVFHRTANAERPVSRIVYPTPSTTPPLIFGSYGMHTHEVFAYLHTLRTTCGMDAQTTVDMLIALLPKHNTVIDFLNMAKEASDKLGLDQESMQRLIREMARSLSLPFPSQFDELWIDEKASIAPKTNSFSLPDMQGSITGTEISEAANVIRCKKRKADVLKKNKRALSHCFHSSSFLLRITDNLHISSLHLNETLADHGLLIKIPAKNNRSEWQLTKKGERYGANTQMRFGHAVRPLFYGDTFEDMLREIGLDEKPEKEGTL